MQVLLCLDDKVAYSNLFLCFDGKHLVYNILARLLLRKDIQTTNTVNRFDIASYLHFLWLSLIVCSICHPLKRIIETVSTLMYHWQSTQQLAHFDKIYHVMAIDTSTMKEFELNRMGILLYLVDEYFYTINYVKEMNDEYQLFNNIIDFTKFYCDYMCLILL